MSLENFDAKKVQQEMMDRGKAIIREVRIEQKKFDGDAFERILSNKNLSSDEREYYLELKRKSDELKEEEKRKKEEELKKQEEILKDPMKEISRLNKIIEEQKTQIKKLEQKTYDLEREVDSLESDVSSLESELYGLLKINNLNPYVRY